MHALDRGRVRGTQDGSRSGSPPCYREDSRSFGLADGVDPAENNKLYVPDGAGTLPTVLRDLFAPDAMDAVYQDATKSSHFRETTQTMPEYLDKFDLLCSKAEGRMQPGSTFSEASVAVLCLQNA